MKKVCFLFFLLLVGILAWVFSPLIYDGFFYLGLVEDEKSLNNRALFGDSFGALTSLFSFLSFISVLLVLFLTQYYEGRKEKPFIITNAAEPIAVKIQPLKDKEDFYKIEINLEAKNYSNTLAHSMKLSASLISENENHIIKYKNNNRPITSNVEKITFTTDLSVDKSNNLLDSLSSNRQVLFKINVEFKNTHNVTTKNTNSYYIVVNDGDHDAINKLRIKDYNHECWASGKFVTCKLIEHEDFIN